MLLSREDQPTYKKTTFPVIGQRDSQSNQSNQNKPLIPDQIPRREFEEVEFDPDQVQIECMVDKDGKEIKRVKPILIKKGNR